MKTSELFQAIAECVERHYGPDERVRIEYRDDQLECQREIRIYVTIRGVRKFSCVLIGNQTISDIHGDPVANTKRAMCEEICADISGIA